MAAHKGTDRRGSGPLWFLMLVVTVFVLYSVAVAVATGNDCNGRSKGWQVIPPRWNCHETAGYG